ncbi:MAG: amidase [Hyphomicrobiaceae bacterium]
MSSTTARGRGYAADPGRLAEMSREIAEGRLSPVALLERYLARIDEVEGAVKAWREIDREGARKVAETRAREAKAGRIRGVLHGIPVGVKDIIDVEGLPSRCNSRSRENAPPASADAEVVLALKTQGAIMLGKLNTTEFAYFDPSPAGNPWNPAHTPGGSSSGSGAAVGAGTVPVALGTQTMASVNRPAAYCGVSAFKPSTRSMSGFGVAPLAASYDTVGFYGGRVDDAVTAFEAAAPRFLRLKIGHTSTYPLKVVLIDDPLIADMAPDMAAAYRGMAEAIAKAGHSVETRSSGVSFERVRELHRSTMVYEAGRAHRAFIDLPPGQIGTRLLEAIREGLAIPTERYLDERGELDAMRRQFFPAHRDAHVFLWPAAPGAAPAGLASTGDPRYIAPWTMLGGPIVTIPAGLGADGLPLGCILSARPGADAEMCDWARRIAGVAEVSPFA